MEKEKIIYKLKEIINKDLDLDIEMDEIEENVSLFEDGIGLDSIAIVDLITKIEEHFKITIDEDDLNTKLFSSLNNLSEFIHSKL